MCLNDIFFILLGRGSEAKRNFFVPVVLIVIFLVLLIVPDMTYFLVGVVKSKQSRRYYDFYMISWIYNELFNSLRINFSRIHAFFTSTNSLIARNKTANCGDFTVRSKRAQMTTT